MIVENQYYWSYYKVVCIKFESICNTLAGVVMDIATEFFQVYVYHQLSTPLLAVLLHVASFLCTILLSWLLVESSIDERSMRQIQTQSWDGFM